MPATATAKHVLDLEKKYWDAMKAGDHDTVESLTADPCVVVGSDGVGEYTRKQLSEMLRTGDYHVRSYKVDEASVAVRTVGDDVALVAYKIHEESERGGKPNSLDAFNSSVWVRKGGRWECAMHTEALPQGSKR